MDKFHADILDDVLVVHQIFLRKINLFILGKILFIISIIEGREPNIRIFYRKFYLRINYHRYILGWGDCVLCGDTVKPSHPPYIDRKESIIICQIKDNMLTIGMLTRMEKKLTVTNQELIW